MKKLICELRCWTGIHCYHCTSYPMKTIWLTHSLIHLHLQNLMHVAPSANTACARKQNSWLIQTLQTREPYLLNMPHKCIQNYGSDASRDECPWDLGTGGFGGWGGNVKFWSAFFLEAGFENRRYNKLSKMMQDHTFIENLFIQHLLCAVVLCWPVQSSTWLLVAESVLNFVLSLWHVWRLCACECAWHLSCCF